MSKLTAIQVALKAPKGQRNNFGKYNYRNCEDILEAVKPLLGDCGLTISDSILLVGDRYYVQATVVFTSDGEREVVTAMARESFDKKGMDSAQITGAASSYARKYALNGLFLIDDTKDADSEAPPEQQQPVQQSAPAKIEKISSNQAEYIQEIVIKTNYNLATLLQQAGVNSIWDFPADRYNAACDYLKSLDKEQFKTTNGE